MEEEYPKPFGIAGSEVGSLSFGWHIVRDPVLSIKKHRYEIRPLLSVHFLKNKYSYSNQCLDCLPKPLLLKKNIFHYRCLRSEERRVGKESTSRLGRSPYRA